MKQNETFYQIVKTFYRKLKEFFFGSSIITLNLVIKSLFLIIIISKQKLYSKTFIKQKRFII